MRSYWTCILTSISRNVMYVGVTNSLEQRVAEHSAGTGGAFTRKHRVSTLVYAEEYEWFEEAIACEKQIKGWSRSKENAFVEAINPTWADLLAADGVKGPSLRSG